jgi:hypothetical protein
MNMDFANAMRAATLLTRAQKLGDATRIIQIRMAFAGLIRRLAAPAPDSPQ